MKQYLSLNLIFGIFCLSSSCKPTCEVSYIFEVPHQIHSLHDTLSIGDTLWIDGVFSDNLYDKLSKNRFVIPPDKLNIGMGIKKIDTTVAVSGNPFFTVYNVTGKIIKGNTILWGEYKLDNHTYSIKSGLVALKKGVYEFYFTSNYLEQGLPLDFDDKCDSEKGFFHFNTNNGIGNHYSLYKNSVGGNPNIIEEYYNNSGSYSFVVK
jgi:hypothetical protein